MTGTKSYRIKINEPVETPALGIPPNVLAEFAIEMWKQIAEPGNHVRALQFLDSLPPALLPEPRIVTARAITTGKLENLMPPVSEATGPVGPPPRPEPPKIVVGRRPLDIVIWTGPAWERWSPAHLTTTGIGGSETAAIHMGRQLAARGHKVTQLGDHTGLEGTYDGVKYVHFQRAIERPFDYPSDILVCSRQPMLFEHALPFKASFLWVHDVHVGPLDKKLTEMFTKITKIFCLSNWHKEFFLQTYPHLPPQKVIVTSNGLDLKRFANERKKDGNRLIYSSSPDRGLERLLELMPAIKAEVPDVMLHVYYGFENWKKMAETSPNPIEKIRVARFQEMLEKQESAGLLKYHGRVNQQELADAFLESKVWSFPTWFTETSCISAMEALAGGCVPVSTHLAALPETVSHGFLIKPPNNTYAYGATFVSRVVSLLKDEELRQKYAIAGRVYALSNYGWDKVAAKWEQHFHDALLPTPPPPPTPPEFKNPLPAFEGD